LRSGDELHHLCAAVRARNRPPERGHGHANFLPDLAIWALKFVQRHIYPYTVTMTITMIEYLTGLYADLEEAYSYSDSYAERVAIGDAMGHIIQRLDQQPSL
jgi:hypothetical protein